MLSYPETIDYLYSRLPMFHRVGAAALKPGLDNIRALCHLLDNPQNRTPMVHLAGTNGKGSTAHFTASILQEAGFRVGLYTSPHLKDFRERIKINGQLMPEGEVIEFVNLYKTSFEAIDASFFEYTTAMAFWYFDKAGVDIAVIETGLGGRLDSTNIIEPLVCAITSISKDHMHLLGDTLEAIAAEKAGIIKHGVPIVQAKNTEAVEAVIAAHARDQSAPLIRAVEFPLPAETELGLAGQYQWENAQTASCIATVLKNQGWPINIEHIQGGLKKVVRHTGFMGRWQMLHTSPRVIADVGHNEDGVKRIIEQLRHEAYNHLHWVLGMVDDKEHDAVLRQLPTTARYYFCSAQIPRALPAEQLRWKAQGHGLIGLTYPSVSAALEAAKELATPDDLVLVAGSVFTVAEIL
ncbi:MAG TPA: folylpolyglutamate synthase/dihydrofolate synthase family protein [Luteibaculaceae bacterium]|nr:folylpolyglutamate synthase/dihydrofolate synthase family protein [Luteibaculaceae bacterium]